MQWWRIYWYDGTCLRMTIVQCDLYSLPSAASSAGAYTNNVFRVERLSQEEADDHQRRLMGA